jgi:hypothetical protein
LHGGIVVPGGGKALLSVITVAPVAADDLTGDCLNGFLRGGLGDLCGDRDLWGYICMSEEIFESERLYQATLSIARTMLRQGLITEDELAIIDTKMREKYRPLLGTLCPEIRRISLTLQPFRVIYIVGKGGSPMRKINKIEPSVQSLPTRKRVAAYARVSIEKGRTLHSLSAQVSYFSAYIQKRPDWEFSGGYAEANIFLRTIFSLARLIGQTAHKAPVYADFLNPVPA